MSKTQRDYPVRVVSLANLKAMCSHVSGTCHRFSVVKESKSRIHVEYSNPDEYGSDNPMIAVFPCFPSGEEENPNVVLEYMRIVGDSWNGEGWQAFEPLRDCPRLWRNPETNEWKTEAQIKDKDFQAPEPAPCPECPNCGQYQQTREEGGRDCFNECKKRGLA